MDSWRDVVTGTVLGLLDFLDNASLFILLLLAMLSWLLKSITSRSGYHAIVCWLSALVFVAYFFHRHTQTMEIEAGFRATLVAGICFGIFSLLASVLDWCMRQLRSARHRIYNALQDRQNRREEAERKKNQSRKDAIDAQQQQRIAERQNQAQQQKDAARNKALALKHNKQLTQEQAVPFPLPVHLYSATSNEKMTEVENTLRLSPTCDSLFDAEVQIRAVAPELPLPLTMFAHYRKFMREYYTFLLGHTLDANTLLQSLERFCALFEEDA